ncbi:MAG TPA: RNB domain-containing ribonuclease, partial [Burkholderiales bacterium]|nr:RNB domain-containing ribonuclease [Burkholderiales bacterium]
MSKKKAKRTALRRRNRADREDAPDQGRILGALNAARAPLSADELAARLRVGRQTRREFDRALSALERAGEIVQNRAGALLVAKRIAVVPGRVEGHPDGHGFLIPDDKGASIGSSIFLPPAEMRQLMHRDRAAVRVTGRDHRGRPTGEIVEVLERGNRRIVGRLHAEHGVLFLAPEDRRIAHDILVPPAEAGKAKAGQVVTVDLIAQPSKHAQPIGRIAEVLGNHADPGMEIEIAVRKFDVPHEFSKKAVAQARSIPEQLGEDDFRGRKDLRDLHFVTIDGETARDFDDAVYARREEGGRNAGWRLWVAIADVSHYVRPGDALDQDARERGTSVYFPRRVIPMLPEKLSNGLCSLNPNVERLAMVCEMAITPQGEVAGYKFYAAVFRSRARLTYTEVWGKLSGGKAPQELQTLYDL